jgi:ABC-type sugar transport system permease subunit
MRRRSSLPVTFLVPTLAILLVLSMVPTLYAIVIALQNRELSSTDYSWVWLSNFIPLAGPAASCFRFFHDQQMPLPDLPSSPPRSSAAQPSSSSSPLLRLQIWMVPSPAAEYRKEHHRPSQEQPLSPALRCR